MDMKRFVALEKPKDEMLHTAERCFSSASKITNTLPNIERTEDEWLFYYMLAKIAEKKNEDPPVFLEHYALASKILEHNSAEYPAKINHKMPQKLAIEALEVHYRIHASILKYIEHHGRKIKKSLGQLFEKHLNDCQKSGFMVYESKLGKERKVEGKRELEDKEMVQAKRHKPSHLEVMQDVLALIDDLIKKVCDGVDKKQTEEVMVISSDEGEEVKVLGKAGEKAKICVSGGKSEGESVTLPRAENVEGMIEIFMKDEGRKEEEEQRKWGSTNVVCIAIVFCFVFCSIV